MSRRRFLSVSASALAAASLGCYGYEAGLVLPARDGLLADQGRSGLRLLARLAHISDSHVMDEESPARFAGAHVFAKAAWRPHESYSAQLLDGIIRSINRIHAAGRIIDFVIHTGDACDNAQSNELAWFLGVMDGGQIDPLSGLDDRPAETRPDPSLDQHVPFEAQGLYCDRVHGHLPSIPWYVVPGNHDAYALGVFPIVHFPDGRRTAPLPLAGRPGLVLPVELNPVGTVAYGAVSPAEPGPPPLLTAPRYVQPNPARAYFSRAEFVAAMFETATGPAGHGFGGAPDGATWYSVSPVPGLRLIGLDTSDRTAGTESGRYIRADELPGRFCHAGALTRGQFAFLQAELDAAAERGELVIVATHHPSSELLPTAGTEVRGEELTALLNAYSGVMLHLAGHRHRNRVTDRGGYLEIETCATLDRPQEGRLIEIWQDQGEGSVALSYEGFSHLDDTLPPLGEDTLHGLRAAAAVLSLERK